MKTFKEILDTINEQKQVGTLYHFTTLENLFKILGETGTKIVGETQPHLKTGNKNISLTRSHTLSTDLDQLGVIRISSRMGYIVRISLDGNKISNKYKIRPVRGMTDPNSDLNPLDLKTPNNLRMKSRVEAEEIVVTNILEPYIKQINILSTQIAIDNEKELFAMLDKHKIKHSHALHRKWGIEEDHVWKMPNLRETRLFELIVK